MGDNEEADDYRPDRIIIRPLRVELDATMFPAVRCRFQLINHHHQQQEASAAAAAGTCLLFTSGKMIVTGMRQSADVERALTGWDQLLSEYGSNEEMLTYITFP
jgi:hypothetical protein